MSNAAIMESFLCRSHMHDMSYDVTKSALSSVLQAEENATMKNYYFKQETACL